tara:strand:- start:21732 stop:22019 length:288 start_codon:yes stop_codon:yes gene_type:complete
MKTNIEKKETYNSEITQDDLNVLGDKTEHLRRDIGADSHLKQRPNTVDFEGKDLDIPGREGDSKRNGLKDEENKHHSLGSAHNENLETNSDVNNS